VLEQALQAVCSKKLRVLALADLAPQLPGPLLEQALEAAWAIGNEGDRARVLATLAPWLPAPLFKQALQAIQAISDKESRVQVLADLVRQIPAPLLERALQAAQAIDDERCRARALADLAPQLPEGVQQANVLRSSILSTFWADRGALLNLLRHFLPAIAHLEGPSALSVVERAVRDTGRWFS
jgi:hypothetical protein